MHNYSTLFNFALWTSAVFYSIYKFSTSANLCKCNLNFFVLQCYVLDFKYYEDVYHDFCDSQFIKFRKKDCSDHEWESILRGLYEGWIGFTLHLMISEVLRTNSFSQVTFLMNRYKIFLILCFYRVFNTGTFSLSFFLSLLKLAREGPSSFL